MFELIRIKFGPIAASQAARSSELALVVGFEAPQSSPSSKRMAKDEQASE